MTPKHGKTLKLIAKRLKISKGGKVLRRRAGQGHNKAKMSGALIRAKRKLAQSEEHPLIQKAISKMQQTR